RSRIKGSSQRRITLNHTREITGDGIWEAAIAEGIERAYAVVTLVSAVANTSKWVRVEFLLAEKRGKPIVPLPVAKAGARCR
ncbi:MAG TPA: TIR domain-containing protein, partial [Accumulibacter sp.]|nr:TIR domain-containing protein [Accumulibacter sp.]